MPRKLCHNAHRHTHPRESFLHQPEGAGPQRTLPPHSTRCAAGLPGNSRFRHLSVSCSSRYGVRQKTTTPRVLWGGKRLRRDDCGREGPTGSAFWSGAAWSGGRLQAAGAGAEENSDSVWHLLSGSPQRWVLPGSPIRTGWSVQPPQTTM